MSGWHPGDGQVGNQRGITHMRASNNITKPGSLVMTQNPAGTRSRTLTQAHFKALRCYRHYCRMIPFLLKVYSMRDMTTEASAKQHLARHWRHGNKVRDPLVIDEMVLRWYEKMLNMKQQDVWGEYVHNLFCPNGKGQYARKQGYSFYEKQKYGDKTDFMKDFYSGGRKTLF